MLVIPITAPLRPFLFMIITQNTSGAAGSLWSGGPGYKLATVNLKSQYGQDMYVYMNTTIDIFL
ncbi:hypothetical protein CVS40_1875 [Lucilia cuprina]|nr:hypothetical protein CVS40_1875 [Lucilia cuprina]